MWVTVMNRGVSAAFGAATLFGLGMPLAKLLLGRVDPWLLAGLLYLGSGIGLAAYRSFRRIASVKPRRTEVKWLLGGTLSGGVVGPVLLMWGLSRMPASGASLLLNAEGVLTALIAWFVFRENFDRRVATGMAPIVAGGAVLSWPSAAKWGDIMPALAVTGACLAWAVDNNLTRKVSLSDASYVAMVKGLSAGATNLVLAVVAGSVLPAPWVVLAAGAVGFVSYGASLALFVVALRELGTARTGAYFSTAPFTGMIIAVAVLDEPLTIRLGAATPLMAIGVWLHLTERHEHVHEHPELLHEHEHEHDVHHRHAHDHAVPPGERHTHAHRHEPLTHSHPHYPDAHHRHDHE
ncbi:MAG: EamA family transporter [Betaproteobacteria bacterium]|nr:EamA family transporter [Betaproteobacteria bacterium]